jgi:transcriptional regulator with XRE-family HTH domain
VTETPAECQRLAADLRALRSSAGLTMAELAAASTYSKSSWERYLNGKALPPWAAVEQLCAMAVEPQPGMRALWELAEAAWSGRGVVAARREPTAAAAQPQPETEIETATPAPQPAEPAARPVRRLRTGIAAFVGLALCCAALTAGMAYESHGTLAGRAKDSTRLGVAASTVQMRCHGRSCDGADPGVMECGVEPQTLGDFQTATGAGLEIRYDPLCEAAWARVWHTRVDDELAITAPGVPTRDASVPNVYAAQTFVYTPMVSAIGKGVPLRACLIPAGHGDPECFTAMVP